MGKGEIGGSKSIENILRYIQESNHANVVDEATREIDGYVETVKTDPELKEDEARIAAICSVAEKYVPDYDAKKIQQELTEVAEVKE